MPRTGRAMEILKGDRTDVRVWARLAEIEPQAMAQLRNVTTLPVVRHVAAMPDVHFGKGATVGSVIALRDAVSPAAVGVDIGCGMAAVRTSLRASDLPDDLRGLRREIERAVPCGNGPGGVHRDPVVDEDPRVRAVVGDATAELFASFDDLTPGASSRERALSQCGTLGGGNHFVEVCLDGEDRVWVMLHSGSRNLGKTVAEIHIRTARPLEHNADLADRDLAYFLAGTPEMAAYRRDLAFAQRYAALNRRTMLALVENVLTDRFPGVAFDAPVQCHHNYVSEESHFGEELFVTRKGAISARRGELGIIPGSMGTRSYVVRGLGCEASLCSASHGAGRRMSRGEAKRRLTLDDLARQTAGVECRRDPGVLDEAPAAYKDIDDVIALQSDLVEVVAVLKQVVCVKG